MPPMVKSWSYHYYSTYGSPPVEEKVVEVTNYQLSPDRKTVTFDVPLETNRVYAIQFPGQLNTEAKPLDFDTIYYTVNHLRPAKEPKPGRNVGWSLAGSSWSRNDKARPLPPVVAPLPEAQCQVEIPANALVLDAEQWSNPNWKFNQDGSMPRGQGHNPTKKEFGDARIHLEFRFDPATESEYEGKSQLYGNSGIFLMSAYELQVLNSFQNDTFADGSCGAVYGQHPLVNASRAPGNWQSYDILYKAPVFGTDGSLAEPMRA